MLFKALGKLLAEKVFMQMRGKEFRFLCSSFPIGPFPSLEENQNRRENEITVGGYIEEVYINVGLHQHG